MFFEIQCISVKGDGVLGQAVDLNSDRICYG